jgi:hypothetical protein
MCSLSRTEFRNNGCLFCRVQEQDTNRVGALVCQKGGIANGALLGHPRKSSLYGPDAWHPYVTVGVQASKPHGEGLREARWAPLALTPVSANRVLALLSPFYLPPPPPSTICVRQSTGVLLHAKGTTIFSVLCHHGMARTCTTRAPTWVMSCYIFDSLVLLMPFPGSRFRKSIPILQKG